MTQTSDESAKLEGFQADFSAEGLFPNVQKSDMRAADGTPTFIVPSDQLVEIMIYLRDKGGFSILEDVTAVDWKTEPRFQVVYNMIALSRSEVLRIKVNLPGTNPVIASMTGIWPGANWYEREVFDLFGITFTGHPDLRRIEMPEDWEGHPLRKDYPMTGPRRPNLPSNQFRTEGRTTN